MIRCVWKEKPGARFGLMREGRGGGRSEVDSERRRAMRVSDECWSEGRAEREREREKEERKGVNQNDEDGGEGMKKGGRSGGDEEVEEGTRGGTRRTMRNNGLSK